VSPIIISIIVLALIFDLLNGIRDASNLVATVISSRALSPRWALMLTAVAGFLGPFIFGVAVATAIGSEIVSPEAVNLEVIIAALVAAIIWNLVTLLLGLPSSSSHALIGGLLGAVFLDTGWGAIDTGGLLKILVVLFTSPIIGLVVGWLIARLMVFLCRRASPKINYFFKNGQLVTSVALALSHGANDAQKTMGIITMALVTGGYLNSFVVPGWVILTCAGVIAIGTLFGGRRLIRTLGEKFYKIRPLEGFSSQLASSLVIMGSSLFGGPVSTTQVVSGSIMGVGAADRVKKVRWAVAGDILVAWFLTIPATGLLAAGIYWIVIQFIK
jgi:PiT family inorganic phosphate transporter